MSKHNSQKRRLRVLVGAVIILALSGCSNSEINQTISKDKKKNVSESNRTKSQTATEAYTSEETRSNSVQPVAKERTYQKLTGNVTVEGHSLRVTGETDIPDGGKISVVITRPIIMAGEQEERYPQIGQEHGIILDGKYEIVVSLDEGLVTMGGETPKSIDPNVEVEIKFLPNWYGEKLQSDDILRLVGPKGENLSGSLVKVIGELTGNPFNSLEVKTSAAVVYQ